MKIVQINKQKVRIFEEGEVIEKLGLSREDDKIIQEYQRKFPELLQDNINGFVIDGEKLWIELGKPQSEYGKWFKRKIDVLFEENKDYSRFVKLVGTLNNGGKGKEVERHLLTLDCAKQVSLMSGSDKNSSENVRNIGKIIRDYFIIMEKALRNYETWSFVRDSEKSNWNTMKLQIKNWCERNGFDSTLDVFYIREANMLNQNLSGFKASEWRAYLGAKDDITRNHLETEANKCLDELQSLNISLLIANLSFDERNEIIKTVCRNKYADLYINK